MMRVSTKGDYGVRALIDLALFGGEGPVQRSAIARRGKIPESYLDHLLAQLRREGFIHSTRGPGGGHELAKPAADICLLHVLECLEGSLAPLACLEGESSEHEAICGQAWVWRGIYDATRQRLSEVSIAELAEHEQERLRPTASSYNI